jgi:hypothetical protein
VIASAFRSPLTWYAVLVALCLIAPYLLGVRPRQRKDWVLLTVTIAFLTWLLAGFTSVRSR